MLSTSRLLAICVAILFAGTLPLFAQGDRATLRGVVKDTTGAVIPNAAVSVKNTDTNAEYKTVTTGTGDFTVPNLPVGSYSVRVAIKGFKALVRDGINLTAGDSVQLDLQLQVGETRETIEVSAEASVLQTDTSRVATQVSTKLLNDLPVQVNGDVRSPFDLATITAD